MRFSILLATSCIGPFDVETELCIGYNTTSKLLAVPVVQQCELFDWNNSPVTECAAAAVPVDKEHFKRTYAVTSDYDYIM